ncbi:MAG: enoyl-CoA hydratase-related protein [Chloroflexota bacterium]|nr:enoyl-CoA hydratase-related protein [Chloroflexota bacterium]
MPSSSNRVLVERRGPLAVIRLNRPEARNALSPDMIADLGQALAAAGARDVRAVMLTGTDGAFCAGADVRDFTAQLDEGGAEGLSEHLRSLADALHNDVVMAIRKLDKPVVAAVNGVAAGAGFSLALACDMRIASSDARFLLAYANIGCTADGGSTYMLPRIVGQGRAMDIYLARQPIGAQYALELGLVSQVFEASHFERHAMETADRLAQGPTQAYGRVKALFDGSWEADLATQLDAETDAIADIGLTGDFQEGIRAFSQKRQAWFQGR